MAELNQTSYLPGRWVAICAPGGWLLVDLPAEDPIVRRCWKLLSEDADADAVLDALVSGGLAATPGFALVRLGEREQRAVVRHPATATAYLNAGADLEVQAPAVVSWTDVVLPIEVDAFSLVAPEASEHGVELPTGRGVTSASSLRVGRGVTEPPADRPDPVVPEPTTAEEPPDGGTAEPEQSYDFLFGATQRPAELQVDPEPVPPKAVPEHTEGWSTRLPTELPVGDSASAPSGIIDGVPWAPMGSSAATTDPLRAPEATPREEPTPALLPESSPGVDVDATVKRAQLRDEMAAAGPTVLAGYCPNRHLSQPHADRCRVCGSPMPAQEAFEIARPVLGMLRLSTGDVVSLDRGVLLGRSPEVPTDPGLERPHAVRLPSPENDISRNHAEVVLDGWNVYIRDHGSTNGTVVELPGQPPIRLRADDLQLIENGTRVTLADEVSFTFEVAG